MSDQEMIVTLSKIAKNDPVLSDVMFLFSTRKRARFMISVEALQNKMTEEKFEYSRKQLGSVFETLAQCGIGRVQRTPKGHVKALVDLKVRIPDLGKAILGEGQLRRYRQRHRFQSLPGADVSIPVAPTSKPAEQRASRDPRPYQIPGARLVATVLGNSGQVVANVTFTPNATKEEIADFFARALLEGTDSRKDVES